MPNLFVNLRLEGRLFLKSWKVIPHFSLLSAREPLKDSGFVSKYLSYQS